MNLSPLNKTRLAALLLTSVLALPALAQTDTPPPPPQDQTQGPPPPPPSDGPGRPGGRRGGPEQRLGMLNRELNLTPDQAAKVKSILESGRTQMEALRNSGASPEDNRDKMMTLRKTENEQIKAVLTADQRVKFDELEKRQRERMREGRRGGPGGPPPNGDGSAPPPPPPPPQQK